MVGIVQHVGVVEPMKERRARRVLGTKCVRFNKVGFVRFSQQDKIHRIRADSGKFVANVAFKMCHNALHQHFELGVWLGA